MSSITPALTPAVPSGVAILNNTTQTINGTLWEAQNFNSGGATPYSHLSNTAIERFEVINGQNCVSIGDPAWVMRSEEFGPTFPFNTNVTFTYNLLVRSQHPQPTTNNWMIFGQIHGDDNHSGPPPFAFDLQPDPGGPTGEKLQFDLNCQATGAPSPTFTNIGSIPFSRNTLYAIQLIFRDANGANTGFVQVTINGSVVATYSGVTGYSIAIAESYPKWGIYTGGNGASFNTPPLPGQDIVAEYSSVTFTSLVPAFYVADTPVGNDSNPGTFAAPFLTFAKCAAAMVASSTIKTTYLMDTGGSFNVGSTVWATPSGTTWLAYPGMAPVINTNVSNSGGNTISNVTISGNITINGFATDGSGVLAFPNSTGITLHGLTINVSGAQQCIDSANLQNSDIAGCTLTGPTTNNTNLATLSMSDSVPHSNVTVRSNSFMGGGRIQLEWQNQHSEELTDCHVDWNTFANNLFPISFISSNAANTGNTLWGNTVSLAPTNTTPAGIEFAVGGCTVSVNTLSYLCFGISISACPGAAILNNTIRLSTTFTPGGFGAFTPGGSYNGTEWIGVNTIVFTSSNTVTGCVSGSTGQCTLGHGAYGAQPTLYSPSAPYAP